MFSSPRDVLRLSVGVSFFLILSSCSYLPSFLSETTQTEESIESTIEDSVLSEVVAQDPADSSTASLETVLPRIEFKAVMATTHVDTIEKTVSKSTTENVDGSSEKGEVDETEPEEIAVAPAPKYLLESLASEFTWDTRANHPRVSKEISRLLRNPRHLDRILGQSEPILALVSDTVTAHDMPIELAFLPYIESGYRSSAKSHRGAAGLWQFMPNTAKHLGMEINWWHDERLDIETSTDKALEYLTYLNNRFNGDWELALAAYNGGESYISRRLKRSKKEAKDFDYWETKLKKETQDYVPRLLALIEIISSPEKYGVELPKFALENPLVSVNFENQIDLRQAAEEIGMDYSDLRGLNADFLRWISPPKKTNTILVPAEKESLLIASLDKLSRDGEQIWNHYRVRQGDTLSEIASQFGVTLKSLVAVNQLENYRLKINQQLLIPNTSKQQAKTLEPGPSIKRLYVVKRGDSLWEIAKSQDVSIAQIKSLNRIGGNVINPGQVLVLAETYTGDEFVYQVRHGDSLYEIAVRFKVAVAELKAWNDLDGNLIKPGQELTIRTNS